MQLERVNDALSFLKRPRVTSFPLQITTLNGIYDLPVWANLKRHFSELEQRNDLEDPILYNPVFKLPSLEQLDRLYYHTIYESVRIQKCTHPR